MVRRHDQNVTDLVASRKRDFATNPEGDPRHPLHYYPDMVTKPQKSKSKQPATKRLFVKEWMDFRDLSDQELGDKLDLPRQTIYRWRTQERRLDAEKMALIAEALGLEPVDLWRSPKRRSVDAMLTHATPEQVQDTLDFVGRFILK